MNMENFTENSFYEFFEKNILPLCENNTMILDSVLIKLWEEYRNWNTEYKKGEISIQFSSRQEFLNIYWLDVIYIQWDLDTFKQFFKKFVIINCKNNILPNRPYFYSLDKYYKSWYVKLLRFDSFKLWYWREKFLERYRIRINEFFNEKEIITFYKKVLLKKYCKKWIPWKVHLIKKGWNYKKWALSISSIVYTWKYKTYNEFLIKNNIYSNFSTQIQWKEKEFLEFFEKTILPLCNDKVMISSNKLLKMWWKYMRWNAKFRRFDISSKYNNLNEFVKLYWLKIAEKWMRGWSEECFFDFLDNKILPRCSNSTMLSNNTLKQMWWNYSRWNSKFRKFDYTNRYSDFKTFLKLYWLKKTR